MIRWRDEEGERRGRREEGGEKRDVENQLEKKNMIGKESKNPKLKRQRQMQGQLGKLGSTWYGVLSGLTSSCI